MPATDLLPAQSVTWRGDHLAVGSEKSVLVWNQQGLAHRLAGHTSKVFVVTLSPDGQRVASGADAPSAWVRALDGAQKVVVKGKVSGMRSISFAPDGKAFVAGRVLWNLDGKALSGPEFGWLALFDTGGKSILCGSAGEPSVERRSLKGALIESFPTNGVATCLAQSADGSVLVVGDESGHLQLFGRDMKPLCTVMFLKGKEDQYAVNSVAISADGNRIAAGAYARYLKDDAVAALRIYDRAGTQVGKDLEFDPPTQGNGLCFSPDGRYLIAVAPGPVARIWNVATGRWIDLFAAAKAGWAVRSAAKDIDGDAEGGTLVADLSEKKSKRVPGLLARFLRE